jgi:transcriptional regulator with XRE-family HTH domain
MIARRGGNKLFNNLRAEMARQGITKKQVAAKIGLSPKAFYSRMTGRTKFKYMEAVKIRDFFFKDLSLDYLFFE